uniref:Ribonuclease H-like domain-containing protein n=1 Tax=Tanacetum cinerariifolium TaxID=118510 RepID=A0A699GP04_TANCI|nr:ribonuclease H-like domain-containing protein [Tanacetum cinerariifolium]
MPVRSFLGLDLLPGPRVFEYDVKGSTGSSSSSQNVAFVSSENTSSTNEVNTAYGGSTSSGHNSQKEVSSSYTDDLMYSFFANQSSGPQLNHEDLDQMSAKYKSGLGYGSQIHDGVLSYENEVFASVFDSRSSDVEDSPVNDRFAKVEGMHAVPPPMIGNYMPPKYAFGIDESKFTYGPKQSTTSESNAKTSDLDSCDSNSSIETLESIPKPVANKPKVVSEPKVWYDAPIIEECELNSDDEHATIPSKEQEKPSFAFVNTVEHIKTPRQTVKEQHTCNQNPKPNNIDWDGLMSKRMGLLKRLALYVVVLAISSEIVISMRQRMAKQIELNKQKVNAARQNFTSQASLTSATRKVNTARPKVNENRPRQNVYKSHSPIRRPFNKTTSPKANFAQHKFNTAWDKSDNPHQTFKGKGIFDSGCSKHMTGKKAYLVDYKDFNGGPVAFGGSKGQITGKGKIKTGKSDFEDVYFVKELQHFNLFSVSQMCGKKNKATVDESTKSYRRTKDETSGILKDFIRQIKNQLNQKVKIIRCDNGTKFKNRDIIEFYGSKGIKRECSNARIPQQNGVTEKMNRTLIEAARTMLADSFLPNTFWAKAVSTDCYVLNRVLVTKPQNKTPYELLNGKIPIISYIRPFGCHVTILNTIDHLGKFTEKSDEGFLVGYSQSSKAFKVYNLETKRVKEIMHINFLENKPNVAGKRPTWLFDLDYLTASMDYQPITVENQANKTAGPKAANNSAGTQDNLDAGKSKMEANHAQEYYVLPLCIEDLLFHEGAARASSTNLVNTATTPLNAASTPTNQDNSQILALEDIYDHSKDIQKVWILVDLPFEKKAIGTKWVYKNKKDERGVVVRNMERLQVKQKEDGIFISQDKYVAEILKKFDFLSVKTASTPIETKKPLVKDEEAADVDVHLYRSMIGSLMYLTSSRPDIMRLISWQCKKQTIIATSTTEAEYVAAASCCKQVLWIQNQMLDYGFNFMNTKIYINNESTICIVKNPLFHSKTKHIEIRNHFIRDAYEKKLIQVLKIHTDDNGRTRLICLRVVVQFVELFNSWAVIAMQQLSTARRLTPLTESSLEHDTSQDPRVNLEGTGGSGKDQVKLSYDSPLLGGHTFDKAEGSLNLEELSALCTNFSNRVLALETVKDAQAKEILTLKARIKKLEKRCKPSISHHRAWLNSVSLLSKKKKLSKRESVSKHRRKNAKSGPTKDDSAKLDAELDEDIEYIDTKEAVNEGRPDVSTARQELSTAGPTTHPTTTTIFDDEEMTLADTLIKLKDDKAKGVAFKDSEDTDRPARPILTLKPLPTIDPKDTGKGVLEEPESAKKMTKSDFDAAQIARDEEIARQLEVELQAEVERERQREEQASMNYIANLYDEVQARIDDDHELAVRLTHKEQENYTVVERAKFAHSQLNKKSFKDIQGLYMKEHDLIVDFVPSGSKEDERRIRDMNKKAKEESSDKEDGIEIHMLAERRYPLTTRTLERMLSLRLIAESASDVVYDLLRFIQKQIDESGGYDRGEKDL